ncbi:hypothetical protein ABT336_17450 [Micromonospora sp. NPDC000207]|uniref:hypothetical protein n=1 Tax=Micromonospora sp. NPDC000207 TaxID=3154246 RepID=UPI00332486A3
MSDLLWEDIKVWFDPYLNGALPDIHIPATTAADWQKLLDLLQSEDWQVAYLIDDEQHPLPTTADDILGVPDKVGVQLNVRPAPGILAIFRPYEAEQIDFDVDLRELQGQHQVDLLFRFLTTIGRRLRKPVLMTPEGTGNEPVLGYHPEVDQIVLLTDDGSPWHEDRSAGRARWPRNDITATGDRECPGEPGSYS